MQCSSNMISVKIEFLDENVPKSPGLALAAQLLVLCTSPPCDVVPGNLPTSQSGSPGPSPMGVTLLLHLLLLPSSLLLRTARVCFVAPISYIGVFARARLSGA
jgi:hypothetical protein